jgi:maltose alpha-D-glucosyltransferase/alpha-amylase
MRINLGIWRRLVPLLDNDRRKRELIYSLLFTLPGSSIIYYGDEIGMGDIIWLPDRRGVRTAMQWNSDLNACFSDGPALKLFAPILNDDIFEPQKVNVHNQQHDPGFIMEYYSQNGLNEITTSCIWPRGY